MPQADDPIIYGMIRVPTVRDPIKAMLRTLPNGTRVWKSVTALRWVPLPATAVFTPDAVQPQDAATTDKQTRRH